VGDVTQARVSQIEHGKITEVDAIRGYVEALGGEYGSTACRRCSGGRDAWPVDGRRRAWLTCLRRLHPALARDG
jgi:hypothetical protein